LQPPVYKQAMGQLQALLLRDIVQPFKPPCKRESHPLRQAAHQTLGEDVSWSPVKGAGLWVLRKLSLHAVEPQDQHRAIRIGFSNIFPQPQGDTLTTRDKRM